MTFTCARCDIEADSDAMPEGWGTRESTALGTYCVCPECGKTDGAKIENRALSQAMASGRMDSDAVTPAAQTRLRTIVERVERVEEEQAAMAADKKEIYAEAKGEGFDVNIIRKVVSYRKKDPTKRDEEEAMFDLYLTTIGQ